MRWVDYIPVRVQCFLKDILLLLLVVSQLGGHLTHLQHSQSLEVQVVGMAPQGFLTESVSGMINKEM